jgi:methyl-accepting chemotaxis protein
MAEQRLPLLRRLLALRHGLAARFTALFLVMAVIVAVTGMFGIAKITLVGSSVQEMVRTRAAQEKMAVLMKVTVQESRVHLLEAAMAFKEVEDFDFARDDYEMMRDRFRGYVNLLLKGNAKVGIAAAPAGSKLEQKINAVQAVWTGFEDAAGRLLSHKTQLLEAAKADSSGNAAKESLSDLRLNALIREDIFAASGKVETAIDDLLVTVGQLMNETREQVAAVQRKARIALISVIVSAVALALLLGMAATSRLVIQPLLAMKGAAERVASGDLTHTLPIRGRSEISLLGEAINTMAANLKEMFLKIREVTESLSQTTGDIVSSSRQVMSAADVQRTAVETTAGAVADLSVSNTAMAESAHRLSQSAVNASAVITQTRQAINSMAGNSDVLESSVEETASSVHEMLMSIREISQGLELFSASSEKITSSVTQVSASTREIEHHASESVGLAEQVLADASGRGAAAAGDAIAGIEHIRASVGSLADVVQSLGKRSQDIGSILTIIDDIADRTNLLALNAAILSAQAGVHGRGFAVVASEIKHLAEKTSKSVKEIGGLIATVREETSSSVTKAAGGLQAVDAGLRLVRGVESALGSIAKSSVASSEMAKAIRRSTAEESQAVGQIAQAIQEMVGQAENIARALQEQNTGSVFISGQTEKMKDVSRQVRGAIGEQRQGSAHMVEAIGDVARQAEAIAQATGRQKEKSADIVRSMDRIQEATGSLVVSSNGLKATVGALTTAAQKLHDELEKFTV